MTASWRDVLPIHPAAELFPPMSPDDLSALGKDIIKNGLTASIVLWRPAPKRELQLIDGVNRLDAIEKATGSPAEVGAPSIIAGKDFLACDRVIVLDQSIDPYAYVISANMLRRHLTAEQKRELIAKLLKADPSTSDRQIAEKVKVDHKTVGSVRAEKESTGEIPQLKKTVGKDRKARAKPKRRTVGDVERDVPAKTAAVPKPPTETVVREAVAPDEQLALLWEFAAFVINRAKSVRVDPEDHDEWKTLRSRVKQTLGGAP
jgi:hypothetical protein